MGRPFNPYPTDEPRRDAHAVSSSQRSPADETPGGPLPETSPTVEDGSSHVRTLGRWTEALTLRSSSTATPLQQHGPQNHQHQHQHQQQQQQLEKEEGDQDASATTSAAVSHLPPLVQPSTTQAITPFNSSNADLARSGHRTFVPPHLRQHTTQPTTTTTNRDEEGQEEHALGPTGTNNQSGSSPAPAHQIGSTAATVDATEPPATGVCSHCGASFQEDGGCRCDDNRSWRYTCACREPGAGTCSYCRWGWRH